MKASTYFLRRTGFTLIETLIVISIMGVVAGLSVGVYFAQISRAKYAATVSLVQMLNDGLQERLESFYAQNSFDTLNRHRYLGYGTLPTSPVQVGTLPNPVAPLVAIPGPYVPHNTPGSSETQGVKDKRSRLIARLDAMRGSFPQQFIDFMRVHYNGGQVGDRDATNTYIGLGDRQRTVPGRAAIYMEFLRRTNQLTGTPPAFNPAQSYTPTPLNHRPETESSECLYLILTASSSEGSTFDVNKIDPQFIADTDRDGLLEFVDSWGTPLRFYRWPTDYIRYLIEVNKEIPDTAVRNLAIPDSSNPPDFYTRYKYWRNALDHNWLLTRTPPAALLPTNWFDVMRDDFEGYVSTRPDYGAYFRLHDIYSQLHFVAGPRSVNLLAVPTEAAVNNSWTYPIVPLIVSAGPDALGLSPTDRWKAFGLAWRFDPGTGVESVPLASDLDARCARVGGWVDANTNTFSPQVDILRYVGDNIVSVSVRSGQGS